MSDKEGILGAVTTTEPKGIAAKTQEALEDGLLVLFRLKNNRIDYSLMNRPEPTLSGVDDHTLATAIVHAGREFVIKRIPRSKLRERVQRDDGREVTYKESVDIGWDTGTIHSTRGRDLTLQVLSVVVENLMAAAMRADAAKKKSHGPN